MKKLLLVGWLAVSGAGCGKKSSDPAPPVDAFLGHWQSDGFRMREYDAAGRLLDDRSYALGRTFDVTPTAVTTAAGTATETFTYVRAGESLTATSNPHFTDDVLFVRALTPAGFTFEQDHTGANGHSYVVTVPYHR